MRRLSSHGLATSDGRAEMDSCTALDQRASFQSDTQSEVSDTLIDEVDDSSRPDKGRERSLDISALGTHDRLDTELLQVFAAPAAFRFHRRAYCDRGADLLCDLVQALGEVADVGRRDAGDACERQRC